MKMGVSIEENSSAWSALMLELIFSSRDKIPENSPIKMEYQAPKNIKNKTEQILISVEYDVFSEDINMSNFSVFIWKTNIS